MVGWPCPGVVLGADVGDGAAPDGLVGVWGDGLADGAALVGRPGAAVRGGTSG